MKYPDLIIIGAPKCGTTALWYNLDKHPDISMATKTKTAIEIHFWGSRFCKKGTNWYKSLFNDNKIVGEKSVSYWSNKNSIKAMKKFIPDVKLILCIRNPIDRAYSNYQMHFKSNKVGAFNFNLFIKRYSSQGVYINHIKNNILRQFDESQLHICVAERMKNDTTYEMSKVFNFLGVNDIKLKPREVEGKLLQTRNRKEDIEINRNEKFYRVWSRHTEKLKGPLREQLLRYYRPHNRRLFEHLGYKIKEWNN